MIDYINASDVVQIQIHECGKERCIPTKNIVYDEKKYYIIHYITSGKGTYILNDQEYKLKKGQIFYIPPHAKPHYFPDKVEPWSYVWVGFSGISTNDFLNRIGLSAEKPIYSDSNMELKELFNSLADSYLESRSLDIACLGYLYLIFGSMIRKKDKIDPLTKTKESHVLQAKEFIKNNYQFEITIKDIALSLNLSPNYLSNIFQEVLGITTKKYLIKVRMDRACILLQDKKLKIKDISRLCGYPNSLHFSGEFKKYTNYSPLEYRKKQGVESYEEK